MNWTMQGDRRQWNQNSQRIAICLPSQCHLGKNSYLFPERKGAFCGLTSPESVDEVTFCAVGSGFPRRDRDELIADAFNETALINWSQWCAMLNLPSSL